MHATRKGTRAGVTVSLQILQVLFPIFSKSGISMKSGKSSHLRLFSVDSEGRTEEVPATDWSCTLVSSVTPSQGSAPCRSAPVVSLLACGPPPPSLLVLLLRCPAAL